MVRSFLEFVEDKKEDKSNAISSKITLGDGNDYEPFVISDDKNSEHYGANKSLAPIVRAFKKGANWGWSKDEKTGTDKAVKITGKKLFLTGGALRDHLVGKKPRNMELVTNASPDEIYHLLKQNDFEFSGEDDGDSNQDFWVLEKDVNGRPYKFGIRVKNDEYELSVFSSNSKGIPGEYKPGTQQEDASSRDFTINAMFLALTNDNGPNKEIFDYFGGLHHLNSGKIVSVGDIDKKLEEDPIRALRYGRMLSRYGKPNEVPLEDKQKIKNCACKLRSTGDRAKIADEFSKIFNYEDCNTRDIMQVYNDLGLIDGVFSDMSLNKEFPKELKELGDKHMPLAWMMKDNMPEDIEFNLTGFDPSLIKKVIFLIKSMGIGESIDPQSLAELRKEYMNSGVSTNKIREWTTKVIKKDERLIDAFIQYVKSPRIHVYISEENKDINSDFKHLVDPITGQLDPLRVEEHKRNLEYRNFREILKKHMPK